MPPLSSLTVANTTVPAAGTSQTKAKQCVVVPSRFAGPPTAKAGALKAAGSCSAAATAASGMPSVRSQLEQQKAAAARSAAAEQLANDQRRISQVRTASLRSALAAADADIAAAAVALSASADRERSLQQRADALEVEGECNRRRFDALQARADALEAALHAARDTHTNLEGQLAEAHDAIANARDVQLPAATRQVEAQRERAERQEARTARLRRLLERRSASLREVGGHLDRLQQAVAPDDDATLDALAQSALASFGTLYAEKGLHTDARFAALQDVLVRLCMKAGDLGAWLPWWLATRRAEAAAREQEMSADDEATGWCLIPPPPTTSAVASSAVASRTTTPAPRAASPGEEAEAIALSPELASGSGRPRPASRLPMFEGIFEGV